GEGEYLYGRALARRGQYSLAEFALREGATSPEWAVPAGLELSAVEGRSGNYDGAIEAATQVLASDPDNLEATLLRADANVRSRNRYAECLSDAESALGVDPSNLDALGLRAVCLLGLKRVDEGEAALTALREAAKEVELSPDAAARYCTMEALFFAEKGDPEEAEQRMDACLEGAPTSGVLIE